MNDEQLKKQFGAKIRQLRKKKGLTQEKLAFKAKWDVSSVAKAETGKANTTLTKMNSLANALKCDVNELFTFHNKETFNKNLNKLANQFDNKKPGSGQILKDVIKSLDSNL